MANREHVGVLEQEITQWNEWRKQHPEARPDLIVPSTTVVSEREQRHGADSGTDERPPGEHGGRTTRPDERKKVADA